MIRKLISFIATRIVLIFRRYDRYYRDTFDAIFKKPLETFAQSLINLFRKNQGLALAEEQIQPGEEQLAERIAKQMNRFMQQHYKEKVAERAGNTKTYGLVRGTFTILPDLPEELKVGLFRETRSFPAWVRFAGPGPLVTPDIENNGILSIGIKVMNVPGKKIGNDEKFTQDFTGISCPTFTTPTASENIKLQREIGRGTAVWYFLNPFDPHYLDLIMQGIYSRSHGNPLELRYYSCVPYCFGEGRAIKYSIIPQAPAKSKVPRKPGDNYLREAMVNSLTNNEVCFDFAVQFQTDAHRMPIEHAGVVWPERLSPFLKVAELRLPAQTFDSAEQLAFTRNLSFTPWHALPEHRPLGNLNRARKQVYDLTSRYRQQMNQADRIEPTGDEQFETR